MKLVYNPVGFYELIIKDSCDYQDFYDYADTLSNLLNIQFMRKVDGFDDLYWDFEYQRSKLTLCYNNYLGISICPLKFKEAGEDDNIGLLSLLKVLNS